MSKLYLDSSAQFLLAARATTKTGPLYLGRVYKQVPKLFR